jgi:cytochrome c oxidase subunit IV
LKKDDMTSNTREIAHDQHTHPTTKTYIGIFWILFVLTAVEVALYYLEVYHIVARGFAIPSLIVLSTVKFVLVVQWYMHLKFDSKTFTGMFVFPLALGALVIGSLFLLYHVLPHAYIPTMLGR